MSHILVVDVAGIVDAVDNHILNFFLFFTLWNPYSGTMGFVLDLSIKELQV